MYSIPPGGFRHPYPALAMNASMSRWVPVSCWVLMGPRVQVGPCVLVDPHVPVCPHGWVALNRDKGPPQAFLSWLAVLATFHGAELPDLCVGETSLG